VELCPSIIQGIAAPWLDYFFKKYIVFATTPKPFNYFDEIWYKERSCVNVHIVIALSNGVRAPGLGIFSEKYFVFATPPKPFGDFDETWYKERYRSAMHRCE
jgi:hypothetical protein